MSHTFPVRIFYEDTDMAGIVYYANDLRYIERARSDWVRDLGIDQLAMKAEGIDTRLITGTRTNGCCESSARDAMMLNYKVVMVTDGNAAITDIEHNSALTNFYLTFGDIYSTDELVEILHKNADSAQVAAE